LSKNGTKVDDVQLGKNNWRIEAFRHSHVRRNIRSAYDQHSISIRSAFDGT